MVTDQSDMNLLAVMKKNEGSLPRQLAGSVIIHDKDKYHIVYHKCNPKKDKSRYGYVEYCPPREGGSFSMHVVCLSMYPVLSEFTYLQIFAVLILNQYNLTLVHEWGVPVAMGPLT